MRIDDEGTRTFAVPTPPESFLQLAQWQNRISSGTSGISNLTPPQRQLPRRAFTWPSLYASAIFAAAAVYELAVALEWIEMGREPGGEARGQVVATIATLAAIGVTVVLAVRRARGPAVALIPLATAAWMVAHFYAFDSYYLPTHERFSETGALSPWWVYGVAVVGVGVAALSRRASEVAAIYVVVCAFTVVAMGIGK
jgi:hypothetical protein